MAKTKKEVNKQSLSLLLRTLTDRRISFENRTVAFKTSSQGRLLHGNMCHSFNCLMFLYDEVDSGRL